MLGLIDVLEPTEPLFDVFCGTSVGALNATYLAANAHLPDMGAAKLAEQWLSLDVKRHLKLDMRGLLGWKRHFKNDHRMPHLVGRSLLDVGAFDQIVQENVPWQDLHRNVREGRVRSLVVSALHIATGRTVTFAELARDTNFIDTRDARRQLRPGPIEAEHVLASSAIPLLFPARRVGDDYFCDGGVRFNTPIAPAIRSGAERLVVVSLLSQEAPPGDPTPEPERVEAFNSPIFLIGKVLNALLLDPLRYDLQVLDRFNRLIDALERVLPPEELEAVQRVLRESRGLPYRKLKTLVFRPTRDVGQLARARAAGLRGSGFSSWLLERTATLGSIWESDLVSFILFDADFASDLIELGRQDAVGRAEEIRAFFA
jgi:NTE family protein